MVAWRIKNVANASVPGSIDGLASDTASLRSAVTQIANERARVFAMSKDIKMTMYAPQASTAVEYRKIFACPAMLLHLASSKYENKEIKINDPLINDDTQKNRFYWFAKWNLATYYNHAAIDLTSTSIKLTVPTTGSLYDASGSSTSTVVWTAIDNTIPIGQQIGWLVFNMYEKSISTSLVNSPNPYELELYGISAEDILLRDLTPTQISAAVIEMRKLVILKYNTNRQLEVTAADCTGITWANPIAQTPAAALTPEIIAA